MTNPLCINRLRDFLLPKVGFILVFACSFTLLQAQDRVFQAEVLNNSDFESLTSLQEYQLFAFDPAEIASYLEEITKSHPFFLRLGNWDLPLTLSPYPLRSELASLTLLTETGIIRQPLGQGIGYQGFVSHLEGGEARFLIRPAHFAGYFEWQGEQWIIEPLFYHSSHSPQDIYVCYRNEDLIVPEGLRCGSPHPHASEDISIEETTENPGERSGSAGCREVEYIAAADWLFYDKYGSVSATINRIETIIILVEGQYTGHFDNDYLFPIMDIVISTCSTCDPAEWTNTTNPGTLLTNFRNWGEAGGFNNAYDVAGLWTGRDFDANIIGVAYIEGVCNDVRYQSLSDFNPSTSLMRSMVSHEFGHNFSSDHDPVSNFIMSPTVSNTTLWSGQSKTAINNYTQTLQCLANCIINPPPVANFTASPTTGCVPVQVTYTDISSNDPTSWDWFFSGGTPSQSTLQHPQILYETYGSYQVNLTAINAYGSDSYTQYDLIQVEDVPLTQFDHIVDELTVYFNDESDRATDYFWDFGDGQTSDLASPAHTYLQDGTYIVTLVSSNQCGQTSSSQVITLWTLPTANFTADTLWGCPPLLVSFTNLSSANVTSYRWHFPGGQPETSLVEHPSVNFISPGFYNISLIVQNQAGSDTLTRTSYIQVLAQPDTSFSLALYEDTLHVGYGGNVDSLWWDFGDGMGSDSDSAVHIYALEGEYEITLTLWTPCGIHSQSAVVQVLRAPIADFAVQSQEGCAPFLVHYQYTGSKNVDSLAWTFPEGQPSSGHDTVMWVLYDFPGSYSSQLQVFNASGSDSIGKENYVVVRDMPTGDFAWEAEDLLVTFEGASLGADLHEWNFGDGETGEGIQVEHIYSNGGAYTVTYMASNDCGTDTVLALVELTPTSILLPYNEGPIVVWPNPATDRLWVRMASPQPGQVVMIDLLGRKIYQRDWKPESTGALLEIQTVDYVPGIYFIQFIGENTWQSLPVVLH